MLDWRAAFNAATSTSVLLVTTRTNSHRFAGFRVLKAPDIPSVLVEMGYLSNRQDTDFLMSKKGIDKVTSAIAKAVDVYFDKREAVLASP